MNMVALAGTIGAFEVKKISGKNGEIYTVCNMSLAVQKKNSTTMWVNLITFNEGLIEKVIIPYVAKGSKIAVNGELNIREYIKDNVKRSSVEVQINDLTLMGSSKKQIEEEIMATVKA